MRLKPGDYVRINPAERAKGFYPGDFWAKSVFQIKHVSIVYTDHTDAVIAYLRIVYGEYTPLHTDVSRNNVNVLLSHLTLVPDFDPDLYLISMIGESNT